MRGSAIDACRDALISSFSSALRVRSPKATALIRSPSVLGSPSTQSSSSLRYSQKPRERISSSFCSAQSRRANIAVIAQKIQTKRCRAYPREIFGSAVVALLGGGSAYGRDTGSAVRSADSSARGSLFSVFSFSFKSGSGKGIPPFFFNYRIICVNTGINCRLRRRAAR